VCSHTAREQQRERDRLLSSQKEREKEERVECEEESA